MLATGRLFGIYREMVANATLQVKLYVAILIVNGALPWQVRSAAASPRPIYGSWQISWPTAVW